MVVSKTRRAKPNCVKEPRGVRVKISWKTRGMITPRLRSCKGMIPRPNGGERVIGLDQVEAAKRQALKNDVG
jgi:hypothetical protein